MAVYKSSSDPNAMLSFSMLPTAEKLQFTCMPWRSTTKGESKDAITLRAWAINHEADVWGDLKAVLTYNGTSTSYKHGCVLRYKPC